MITFSSGKLSLDIVKLFTISKENLTMNNRKQLCQTVKLKCLSGFLSFTKMILSQILYKMLPSNFYKQINSNNCINFYLSKN